MIDAYLQALSVISKAAKDATYPGGKVNLRPGANQTNETNKFNRTKHKILRNKPKMGDFSPERLARSQKLNGKDLGYKYDDAGRYASEGGCGGGNCSVRAHSIHTGKSYKDTMSQFTQGYKGHAQGVNSKRGRNWQASGGTRDKPFKMETNLKERFKTGGTPSMVTANMQKKDGMKVENGYDHAEQKGKYKQPLNMREVYTRFGDNIAGQTGHSVATKDGVVRDTFDSRGAEPFKRGKYHTVLDFAVNDLPNKPTIRNTRKEVISDIKGKKSRSRRVLKSYSRDLAIIRLTVYGG